MLARRLRLKKADFDVTYKEGKQLRHPLISCRYHQRQVTAHQMAYRSAPRLAFVVPRKLAKATERNRWKRRMRHQFREIFRESAVDSSEAALVSAPQGSGCDFIFMLTARGINAPPREVYRAMSVLWQRATRSQGRNDGASR